MQSTRGWLCLVVAACGVDRTDDGVVTSSTTGAVQSANRLASNRLASNRLASNRLASNSLGAAALSASALIDSDDGREVFSYIVSCALPADATVTVEDSAGTSFTFAGSLGLAPGWAAATPSVADRRWVTACLLARTNYFGISVQLSMRGSHDALATTEDERSAFAVVEGAFYGDLFDPEAQHWFACGTSTQPVDPERLCTVPADEQTTMCGFTYEHFCAGSYDDTYAPACVGGDAPWASCDGGGTSWSEVITVFLQP